MTSQRITGATPTFHTSTDLPILGRFSGRETAPAARSQP